MRGWGGCDGVCFVEGVAYDHTRRYWYQQRAAIDLTSRDPDQFTRDNLATYDCIMFVSTSEQGTYTTLSSSWDTFDLHVLTIRAQTRIGMTS
jgi:hypothetical protein